MTAPRNQVIVGDAARELDRLPPESSDMVVTSPPYFRLRDYGVTGQLGLEDAVTGWVDSLVTVSRRIRRVLTPQGTYWLNLGDTYSTGSRQGASRKSLLLGPERLALAMIADGWILRNKLVWQKTNGLPSSVRDRLTCKWEVIYVFAKEPRYFFDLDAIRVPHTSRPPQPRKDFVRPITRESWRGPNGDDTSGLDLLKALGRSGHPLGKNPGDVIRYASSNFRGAHHATFPVGLIELLIRAGCPEARCTTCHQPWRRTLLRSTDGRARRTSLGPSCSCRAASEPGLVIDPFMGAGTTAIAAERLGRNWLGIELNRDFAILAEKRIQAARPIAAAHSP
ncbi:MAG: site-specific DNA-methyltransferase, partial [Frankiaceae bacterium]|nr:site-specific DNA-methyltransferase [Frankiaceae bacterium]